MAMRLHIASRGWQHPGWEGSFYPEDLPPEWRLDYYANEFNALAPTPEEWLGVSPEAVRRWCAEAPDLTFFPLLPPPLDARWTGLAEGARAFGGALGGYLLPTGPESDRAALERALRTLGDDRPWCLLDAAPTSPAGQPAAPIRCVGAGAGPARSGGGTLALARLERGELRALRRLIEGLAALVGPAGEALLLFEGSPPDIELMRQAKTLAELLGYR